MNRPLRLIPVIALMLSITVITAIGQDQGKKLLEAYPDFIKSVRGNSVLFHDGTTFQWDDGISGKDYRALLMTPDLEDQFCFPYPRGRNYSLPLDVNRDPGRIRFLPFFQKMYGASQKEVEANLVVIRWLPQTFNIPLRVTRINSVDKRLAAVSEELDLLPESFKKYLRNPGGTYLYRNVRSEKRLSPHSFGIAIDINVPLSDYWLYDKPDKNGKLIYKNRIPAEIVEIFEKHGFIWGGKWYHYDTMHFEYRPEFLQAE
jgi:peptidoglycan LD-endopeptidase CwlK